jgi:hypothetical protein
MQAGQNWQAFSIAWAPAETDSFLNPRGQTVAGAVMLPASPEPSTYFLSLGLRLAKLVKETPDGMRMTLAALSAAGLLQDYPEDEDDLPRALVMDNEPLKARLQAMGVPGEFPKAPKESPAARAQLEADSLESWLSAVTNLPFDPDR